MSCIFCKIVSGEIPSEIVYQDESVLCFKDLNPQAPTHLLVIPKKHITNLFNVDSSDAQEIAKIFEKIPLIVKQCGITEEDGFRVVINSGEKAGQSVFHLHCHLLSGRELAWPPG